MQLLHSSFDCAVQTLFATDSDLFAMMSQHPISIITKESKVKYFQTINLMVYEAWQLLEGALSPKTGKLLALSPQLWPILSGETNDFGCQDHAAGYAPICFLMKYVKKKERITDPEKAKERAVQLYQQRFVHFQNWEEGLRDKFEEFRRTCDREVYKVYNERKNFFVKMYGLGASSHMFQCTEAYAFPEKWPPLRMPENLEAVLLERESCRKGEIDLMPETVVVEEVLASAFETKNEVKPAYREAVTNKSALTDSQSGEAVVGIGIADEILSETSREKNELETDSSSASVGSSRSETLRKKQDPKIDSELASTGGGSLKTLIKKQNFEIDDMSAASVSSLDQSLTKEQILSSFVYPRGVRKGHSRLLERAPKFVPALKSGQRAFIDKLFDPAQCTKIKFEHFQVFWESVGGKLRNDGTSHWGIIAPDGTPLWGTYKHGGYGLKTIKYLQAAVVWSILQ